MRSVGRVPFLLTAFALACGCGCTAPAEIGCPPTGRQELPRSHPLVGVWVSGLHETGFGPVKNEYVFREDGAVRMRAVFVNEDGALFDCGTFRVGGDEGERLLMRFEGGGDDDMRFWFDGGDLMLQAGDDAPTRLSRATAPLRVSLLRRYVHDD